MFDQNHHDRVEHAQFVVVFGHARKNLQKCHLPKIDLSDQLFTKVVAVDHHPIGCAPCNV